MLRTRRIQLSLLLVVALLLGLSAYVCAQSNITYIYDRLGRLVGVVDPSSQSVATYAYDPVGNITSISRYPSSQVSIITFTPNSGPLGITVTIYGTGFSTTASQDIVKFNGVTASVWSPTPTQLSASVPTGATTGPISVTAPGGSATSSASFTVSASNAPTITGFSPAIGTPGTALTITGTNFQTTPSNDEVKLNVSFPLLTSATATSINTSVPGAAASGKISVSTPYGKAISSNDFFIPPSSYTPSSVGFTGRMAIGGTGTVTISNASQIGLMLFDGSAGQVVSLAETNDTYACNVFSFSILKPDGTTLDWTNTCGSASLSSETLPTTGTYTVFVNPGSTGSATFTLSQNITQAIAFNTPQTVSSTLAGQVFDLTFGGTAGQVVSLAMTNPSYACNVFSALSKN